MHSFSAADASCATNERGGKHQQRCFGGVLTVGDHDFGLAQQFAELSGRVDLHELRHGDTGNMETLNKTRE